MGRLRLGVPLLCLLLTVLLVPGCSSGPAGLAFTWPVASTEATVAAPADSLRYPLTGQPMPPGTKYPISPACVKVANSGLASAYAGVSDADVVYETAGSATGTQLTCLFQSTRPGRVGPLTGAGMSDLWVLPQYGAALFSTGTTGTLAASVSRAGLLDLSRGTKASGSAYKDVRSPRSSAGTYLTGAAAYAEALAVGSKIASEPARLRFSATIGSTPSPTRRVSVPFSTTQVVEWIYDPASHAYMRSQGGHAQRDARTGARVLATNVVVMWVRYTSLDSDIAGGGGFDVTLGGSGQTSVFRGGQRLDGRWKADGQSPPTFTAEDGSAIRLAPGRTWIEAIPLSANITMR